MKASATSNSL